MDKKYQDILITNNRDISGLHSKPVIPRGSHIISINFEPDYIYILYKMDIESSRIYECFLFFDDLKYMRLIID